SVLAHLVPDRYSIRHQGVQLARNAISGIDLVSDPDAVRPELSVPLYDRWSDRYHGGGARARRAPARYLLRRRPLSLRHGGRHVCRHPRRAALLVAEDHRPNVS